jgi:hypothetical protein
MVEVGMGPRWRNKQAPRFLAVGEWDLIQNRIAVIEEDT